jgi:hypothetical protein
VSPPTPADRGATAAGATAMVPGARSLGAAAPATAAADLAAARRRGARARPRPTGRCCSPPPTSRTPTRSRSGWRSAAGALPRRPAADPLAAARPAAAQARHGAAAPWEATRRRSTCCATCSTTAPPSPSTRRARAAATVGSTGCAAGSRASPRRDRRPVVPAAVAGIYDVWPIGAKPRLRGGRVTVRFGPPCRRRRATPAPGGRSTTSCTTPRRAVRLRAPTTSRRGWRGPRRGAREAVRDRLRRRGRRAAVGAIDRRAGLRRARVHRPRELGRRPPRRRRRSRRPVGPPASPPGSRPRRPPARPSGTCGCPSTPSRSARPTTARPAVPPRRAVAADLLAVHDGGVAMAVVVGLLPTPPSDPPPRSARPATHPHPTEEEPRAARRQEAAHHRRARPPLDRLPRRPPRPGAGRRGGADRLRARPPADRARRGRLPRPVDVLELDVTREEDIAAVAAELGGAVGPARRGAARDRVRAGVVPRRRLPRRAVGGRRDRGARVDLLVRRARRAGSRTCSPPPTGARSSGSTSTRRSPGPATTGWGSPRPASSRRTATSPAISAREGIRVNLVAAGPLQHDGGPVDRRVRGFEGGLAGAGTARLGPRRPEPVARTVCALLSDWTRGHRRDRARRRWRARTSSRSSAGVLPRTSPRILYSTPS